MRVSYKWLQEYVDIPVTPLELTEKLTAVGLEVESYNDLGAGIEKVYTGKIEKIEPHPNADKLVITHVDVGREEKLQIVTGASNIKENDIVPVAVEGGRLAGGMKIKKTKLRGIQSRGMLCSGGELGIDPESMPEEQANGIMILPAGTPIGEDAKRYTGLDDVIIDLELTPNRGDCLSMVGIAREVSAIFNTTFRMPEPDLEQSSDSIEGKARVDIQNSELCPRYIAKLLTNVKIFPSPVWMQGKLRAAGIRPINNIVDVTNYVLMELGQPLHAFDYQRLKEGHIIVRRASEGEKLLTLDGMERELTKDMLVIADPSGPVAIAGVMGGLNTEVSEGTTMVLLESANFNPVSVRRTSNYLALRSEASLRFEKGVDINGCLRAANRAAELLFQMGACDIVSGEIDNSPVSVQERTISFRPSRATQVLGKEISANECKRILQSLQFDIQDGEDEKLLVTVPTFRIDVSREIDLIEEVARIYGYDKMPETLPAGESTWGGRSEWQDFIWNIRKELVSLGLYEVITYSFHSNEVFDRLRVPATSSLRKTVKLQNPLSEEQAVMRTFMLPGILEVLQRNYSRRNYNAKIFDMGKVFYPRGDNELPQEEEKLAVAVMGKTERNWNTSSRQMDFYYIKGILEKLMERLDVDSYTLEPVDDNPAYHPGRTAGIYINRQYLGIMGELHPLVLENNEVPQRVNVFEMNLELLFKFTGNKSKYTSLPKYPAVDRDLAVIVSEDVLVRDIFQLIQKAGGELLRDIELFDVYKGDQVDEGCQSLAFSLKFQARDRTLTDNEINDLIETITSTLQQKIGARLRS